MRKLITLILLSFFFNYDALAISKALKKYCLDIEEKFKIYRWQKPKCEENNWYHVRNSFLGNPIPWVSFESDKNKSNTTLIICGVHGDEINTIKFCFDIIEEASNNKEFYKNANLVIVPLVTPDSFLKSKPTRTNHRGIDVNRNFPTRDFKEKAHKLWKSNYKLDPRRNPGENAGSEQETIFQMNIIKRYKPNKIISVHSPLQMLDYDGPEIEVVAKEANKLLNEMSEKAEKYRIKTYRYFPGSLGNWAGRERNIPTYTLELPNSSDGPQGIFWPLFKEAFKAAIQKDLNEVSISTIPVEDVGDGKGIKNEDK